MNEAVIIHFTSELLWVVLILSLPVVVVASAVGILVSLFQALTQIQDQSLQFLIKLVAVCITLITGWGAPYSTTLAWLSIKSDI